MNHKLDKFISGSKVIDFLKNFNNKLLIFFYNSNIYKLFMRINTSFRNSIVKNIDNSQIIRFGRKIFSYIGIKDVGILIVLVVVFNTLAMFGLKKEIDIFSGIARGFFFCLGMILIFHGGRNR